jgi:hypothetical protein
MRTVGFLLGLAVSIGAGFALHNADQTQRAEAVAFDAIHQDTPDYPRAIQLYKQVLRTDSASPYRWSDLAEAFAGAGELDPARYCYREALALGGDVPQIWLRAANFHFNLNESKEALPLATRVLKTVPDYDSVLFEYFDQFVPADLIFVSIGTNRRIVRSYLQHLIETGNLDLARVGYRSAYVAGFLDNSLTASYIGAMIQAHRAFSAQQDWLVYLGARRSDYPERNLIYNYGFENDLSGVPFDWRVTRSEAFDTEVDESSVHGGNASLRITFHGDANVSYNNLEQATVVTPGSYTLSAWVRTQGITTNEGPRIVVNGEQIPGGVVLRSDSLAGTSDWRLLSQSFSVARNQVLRIGIIREPSRKFDNKIAGSMWLDDVRLFRAGN